MEKLPLGFETRSQPTLTRSCPRRFAFYVARPTRSIRKKLAASRRKVRACEPLARDEETGESDRDQVFQQGDENVFDVQPGDQTPPDLVTGKCSD